MVRPKGALCRLPRQASTTAPSPAAHAHRGLEKSIVIASSFVGEGQPQKGWSIHRRVSRALSGLQGPAKVR